MKTIIPTIITVEAFALVGYYLGRFLAPFLVNRFTIRFIFPFYKSQKEIFSEWTNLRLVQNFASAGSGVFSALGVGLVSFLFAMEVTFPLWFFTALIVAWFSASNGATGRLRCSIISFIFYWTVFIIFN